MVLATHAGTIDASDLTASIMTDGRDRPPILRALFLLIALVGTALALAALSPATPEAPAGNSGGANGSEAASATTHP
jgi:hypothetical protein